MSTTNPRQIPDRLKGFPERALKSWETLLVVVMVAIFTINSFASPYFLDPWNLSDATFNFTEKALVALREKKAGFKSRVAPFKDASTDYPRWIRRAMPSSSRTSTSGAP